MVDSLVEPTDVESVDIVALISLVKDDESVLGLCSNQQKIQRKGREVEGGEEEMEEGREEERKEGREGRRKGRRKKG